MKQILTNAIIAISILTNASAQNLQKSINQVNNTINNTNGTVQNAKVTLNQTTDLIKGVAGFFKKNKNNEQTAQTQEQTPSSRNSNQNTQPLANNNSNINGQNQAAGSNGNVTVITVSNMDYMKQKALSQQLKENKDVLSVEPSLSGTTVTFNIKHTGSTDAILDFVMEKSGSQFKVNSFQNGSIDLASK